MVGILHGRDCCRTAMACDLCCPILVLLVSKIFSLSTPLPLLTYRYPTAGLDSSPGAAGPVVLTMVFYEMLYTGMGESALVILSPLR